MRLMPVSLTALLCLSACQSLPTQPPAEPAAAAAETDPANQRTTALLDAHNEQIAQLQQQVAELSRQVSSLEQQQQQLAQALDQRASATTGGSRQPAALPTGSTPTAAADNNQQQAYQQALRLYQGGFYNQALRHLSFAERSGNGSRTEQSALFLLMQSHEKLRNCESVILTGQRFAARFATNPQSAEALYSVGNCQWNMQQRDIARTTWRKLIQTYPQSAAARRANQRLTANR